MDAMSYMPRNSTQGFTLIEILVALAIIAIAMAALIKASGNHTYSASYLKQKSIGHWVAMNEISRLHITQDWPDLGKQKKSTEMASHEWFWLREVKETPDPDTRQIVFTVYADEDREQNISRLIGYISRPATPASSTSGSGQ